MDGRRKYTDLVVGDRTYPTPQAVAAAFGVSAQAVRIAARKGTLHRVGTGRPGVEPMPVLIRGQRFENSRQAAAHLGVTLSAVHTAMMRGTLDTLGLPQRYNGGNSKSVTLAGMCFASMVEADRVLGFKRNYVSLALRRKSPSAMQAILGAVMREQNRREQQARKALDNPNLREA
tara:strand:- start:914 stop:1438 length:525 start_codon:yes stop_codon:yes gene_type:complete